MDQEGGGHVAIDELYQAIQDQKTTEDAVDVAFRRLMLAHIRLGMFDPPSSISYNDIVYNTTELTTNTLHNRCVDVFISFNLLFLFFWTFFWFFIFHYFWHLIWLFLCFGPITYSVLTSKQHEPA